MHSKKHNRHYYLTPNTDQVFNNGISLTGLSGSGKSKAYQGLRDQLPSLTRCVEGGKIMRLFAREHNKGLLDFLKELEQTKDRSYDEELDGMLRDFATCNFTLIESRLAHYWSPYFFNVYLHCPEEERIKRRAKQQELSYDQARKDIAKRDKADAERYTKLYGPHCLWQPEDFHLTVDTQKRNELETLEDILEGHATWKKENSSRLVRTVHMRH